MAQATGTTVHDTSGFGRNLTLNGAALNIALDNDDTQVAFTPHRTDAA
ncbi:hypothetical protein [Streptomyces sp. NPDC003393]